MSDARGDAIRSTVERITEIERSHGATKNALDMIKTELLELAVNRDWFDADEFPPPPEGTEDNSCIYRLAEDGQTHKRALYIQSVRSPLDVPAHNHDTWAVIVGIHGGELNRFYRRTEEGVSQTGSHLVEPGTGVTLLPDDLHSIHIHEEDPVINFHMYGLGLEYLYDREYFDSREQKWKLFPVYDTIIDSRHLVS